MVIVQGVAHRSVLSQVLTESIKNHLLTSSAARIFLLVPGIGTFHTPIRDYQKILDEANRYIGNHLGNNPVPYLLLNCSDEFFNLNEIALTYCSHDFNNFIHDFFG